MIPLSTILFPQRWRRTRFRQFETSKREWTRTFRIQTVCRLLHTLILVDIVRLLQYLDDSKYVRRRMADSLTRNPISLWRRCSPCDVSSQRRSIATTCVRFIQTYVVVTGSNPLVNQAVEKFRLWLIEKFKFYCSLLIDLLDAEAGVVQVIIYYPFNSSLPPSVSFCRSARRAATPRRKRSPSST